MSKNIMRLIKKTNEDGEVFIVAFTCDATKDQVQKLMNQSDSELTGGERIGKLTEAGWVAMPGWEIIDDTIPDWPLIEAEG